MTVVSNTSPIGIRLVDEQGDRGYAASDFLIQELFSSGLAQIKSRLLFRGKITAYTDCEDAFSMFVAKLIAVRFE